MTWRADVTAKAAILGVLAAAGVAAAQDVGGMDVETVPPPEPRPFGVRLDGGWVDAGVVNLTKGDTGFLVGGSVGLGTMFAPWVDFSGGVRYWSADIDRSALADTSNGSVTNISFHPDLRAHLFRWRWMRPYILTGLSAQFVSADIPDDPSLEDALGGFRVGLDTGFGISSAGRKVRWHLEGRREFVEDVGNWSLTLGLGWWPDVHATRERDTARREARRAEAEETVPPAPPIDAAPEIPAAPPAAGGAAIGSADNGVDPLVRDLMERNETLRAEMDSLKQAMQEQKKASEPPPPPAPEGPDLAVSLERMAALSTMSHLLPTDEGWRLVLGGEQAFESGSARLTPAAHEEIRRLADVLLRFPKSRVIVEGHSDSSGDALRNLTLSEDRAAAVRNELILSGVDPTSIRARGLGSGVPVADNSTAEGRARNRRVEIRIAR